MIPPRSSVSTQGYKPGAEVLTGDATSCVGMNHQFRRLGTRYASIAPYAIPIVPCTSVLPGRLHQEVCAASLPRQNPKVLVPPRSGVIERGRQPTSPAKQATGECQIEWNKQNPSKRVAGHSGLLRIDSSRCPDEGEGLFFKTIGVQQKYLRSQFKRLPDDLTPAQAAEMLRKEVASQRRPPQH